MKRRVLSFGRTRFLIGLTVLALSMPLLAHATVHVVQFGGTVGFSFSPASLSVAVGDTVRWQGSFEFHPLSSTSVPAGAAAWQNSVGVFFDYVVLVPGTYNYHCDVHTPAMSGSFSATLSDVNENVTTGAPVSFELRQNFPNPFNPATAITFSIPETGSVTLKVFNLLGGEVATLVNGRLSAGLHSVLWDAKDAASGRYLYRLEAGGITQTRGMVLLR
jgi:plastocyanin